LLLVLLALFCLSQQELYSPYDFSIFELEQRGEMTREEMLAAKPIPLPMVDYPEFRNVSKSMQDLVDNILQTVECPNYAANPQASAGKLFMGGGSCSASYVGNGLVLTAGHCVSNGRGQYQPSFTFCPQHRDGQCPRGQFQGTRAVTHTEYHRGGSFARDVAFIRLNSNPSVPALNLHLNHGRNLNVVAIGWPGNVGGGRRMICSTGPMSAGNRAHNPLSVQIRSTMTFGSSGGPWVGPNGVCSVVSHGTPGTGIMFGPYFDAATDQLRRSI